MNEKNPQDLGREIGQAVQNALRSLDFTELKNALDVTVQEVKQGLSSTRPGAPPRPGYTPPARPAQPVRPAQPPLNQKQTQPAPPAWVNWNMPAIVTKPKVPGKTASVLLRVFGLIGLIPSAIVALFMLGSAAGSGNISGFVFTAALTLGFGVMTCSGFQIRNRISRFQRYRQIWGKAKFYSLAQLASATGQSKKQVARDLKKMLRRGMLPEAYFDEQETTIILDQETYRQYLTAQDNLRKQQAISSAQEPEVSALINEGREYICKIKEANDAIPDPRISERLERLEKVTSQIFNYVGQHPAKQPEIRKFMEYYLPTTLKLVNAYRNFDEQKAPGETIAKARADIQGILDTINSAFGNLLEELYQDDVMDISTDISALETILAQDGLTNHSFKSESEKQD